MTLPGEGTKQERGNSADVDQKRLNTSAFLYISNVPLAAMYLRRIRLVGRGFEAALAHVSTVVTPPAPAARTLAWFSGCPAGGRG